jgi:hypothetical protein
MKNCPPILKFLMFCGQKTFSAAEIFHLIKNPQRNFSGKISAAEFSPNGKISLRKSGIQHSAPEFFRLVQIPLRKFSGHFSGADFCSNGNFPLRNFSFPKSLLPGLEPARTKIFVNSLATRLREHHGRFVFGSRL